MMKYCPYCGKPIIEEAIFCVHCGMRTGVNNQVLSSVILPQNEEYNFAYTPQRTKKVKNIVLACIAICVALCVLLGTAFILIDRIPQRMEYEIGCTKDNMDKFVETVCKNVNGDARIIGMHMDYNEDQSFSCTADLEIALKGKTAEEAEIVFRFSKDLDLAELVEIKINNLESENAYRCQRELILAFEKTLTGKAMAKKYLTTYDKMLDALQSVEEEGVKEIAEYWLTDELYVNLDSFEGIKYELYERDYLSELLGREIYPE